MTKTRGQFAKLMTPGLQYHVNQYLTSSAMWWADDTLLPATGWWCSECGDLLTDTNRKARRKHERKCGVKMTEVEL